MWGLALANATDTAGTSGWDPHAQRCRVPPGHTAGADRDGGDRGIAPSEGCSEHPAGALLNAAIPEQPLPTQAADAAVGPGSVARETLQFH